MMASVPDRLRFKDRILENVGKAIKNIQSQQSQHLAAGSDNPIVLSNGDVVGEKLCEHLDHVFLHGLKHIKHGYWKVVSEFTTKETIKEIKRLQHVTTDLGRGRAWLFVALNECLLESYMRCYEDNEKVVRKYYVKEALLLDQQRVNVLLTLTAGLEYTIFQLEYDVPYLDLGVSMPRPRTCSQLSEQDDDRLSLCSMDSVSSIKPMSAVSSHETLSASDASDCQSINSVDTTLNSNEQSGGTKPVHNELRSDWLDMSVNDENDDEENETGIEVIRLKGHGKYKASRKKKSRRNVRHISNSSPIFNEPLNEVQEENCLMDRENHNFFESRSVSQLIEEEKLKDILGFNSQPVVNSDDILNSVDENYDSTDNNTEMKSVQQNSVQCDKENLNSDNLDKQILELDVYSSGNIDRNSSDLGDKINFSQEEEMQDEKSSSLSTLSSDKDEVVRQPTENVQYDSICDNSTTPNVHDKLSEDIKVVDEKLKTATGNSPVLNDEAENFEDIYSSSLPKKSATSQMHDMVNNIINQSDVKLHQHMFEEEPEELELGSGGKIEDRLHPGEVELSNNAKLELMLDILDNSEEQFIRVYASRVGHTDGEGKPIFILLTDCAIYLLSQKQSDYKFHKETSIPYSSIDYVSLSIFDQIIQIVCTNRRNQYWITTGSHCISKSLTDCLKEQMNHSIGSHFSVLTDATTQKIALKKYIAKECHCDSSEVEFSCYSLIHWDDLEPKKGKPEAAYREGHLLYRIYEAASSLGSSLLHTVQDPMSLLYGQTWKPAYLILKDGMLCIYNDKKIDKPIMFVHMGDDCVGCRRSSKSDRENCIEVIKQDGSSWQLALATEIEANDWLQKLCQAVAEGIQEKGVSKPSSLPCCSILACNKLFMCHEDLQTSFFRTLGSANIEDITSVLVDPTIKTYCILEFESHDAGNSQDKWVLYFNDIYERDRFCKALSDVWVQFFQIEEVPMYDIEDFTLERTCRDAASFLENSLKVR